MGMDCETAAWDRPIQKGLRDMFSACASRGSIARSLLRGSKQLQPITLLHTDLP